MQTTIVAPSIFPLRFAEVVNFRGDFGTDVVNPKGVAFHPGLNQVLVTLTPNGQPPGTRSLVLNQVAVDGSRSVFAAGYHPYRDVESMLAVVPPSGPAIAAGFTAGDVFVNRGPNGEISRLSSTGAVLADIWVGLQSNGLWGGVAFDSSGSFGGQLIALDMSGKIFLINAKAQFALLADLAAKLGVPIRSEGVAVAPTSFGPFGGYMFVGVEGNNDTDPQTGNVYAIDQNGTPTLFTSIGYTAEHIVFVPANCATYYHAQLSFARARENRLWSVSSSQFLARVGRMLVINEMSGDLWEIAWDGSKYLQSLAGRVSGRWTSEGLLTQHEELEGGDFAVLRPSEPAWNDWSQVPGNGTTDARPSASGDLAGNLHLFAKGIVDRRVYMQSMWGNTEVWTGWVEVPPGGLTTNHSIASAMHEGNLHLFAVRDDGHIVHKRAFIGTGPVTSEPWTEVPPGGQVTDAAVSAAVGTGRLVLCAKGIDNQLYINELAVGGLNWSGWSAVPGGGATNAGPALVAFQDELYLFIKGLTSGKILVQARSVEGTQWSQWAELPGNGQTDASAVASSANNQCYVFVRGLDSTPYLNVGSPSGSWSGWSQLPNPGTTDVALGCAALGPRVYLFAKGIQDKALYVRRTIP
jgi:hypothetical protein